MRARHRIGRLRLRRQIDWAGPGEGWSRTYRSWLTSVRFADQASRATLADYRHAHDGLIARRVQLEAELAELALIVPCAQPVARPGACGRSTRSRRWGCAPRSAMESLDHPDQLACYLGIVPSERTTGAPRRLGSIIKAGSTHPRRRLLEAAHHYRRGPAVGEALEPRQPGPAPEISNISWPAQRRRNARWRQRKDVRRKPGGIVAVAIARQLAAYRWEIATCPTALEPTPTPTTRKRLTNSR